MSEHSVFAFSASPRWIPCPGSMAYPENYADGDADGGVYAAEGTAAHELAATCLRGKVDANTFIGTMIKVGKREFEVTEEFADHVQTYVEDARRRAIGGFMMVEQRVTLDGVEGFDDSNYGTSDLIIAMPAGRHAAYGVVEDLKFGMGEKVYAWETAYDGAPFTMTRYNEIGDPELVVPNYQLMMYALACLADIQLLVDEVSQILIVIHQPRLGHIAELWVPIAVLERFGLFAAEALAKSEAAKTLGVKAVESNMVKYLNPGEKQCRWCRALARCPAAAAKAQTDTGADFEVVAETPPVVPVDTKRLATAMAAVPFVADWCRAVMAKAGELVGSGFDIIGPDKKPYKFVEGKLGDRKWGDELAAEAALVATLGVKAYAPQKILTASAASKLLDKKATKKEWADKFVPLIKRAPGKPILVLGSDDRPPYSPASTDDEFEVESDE